VEELISQAILPSLFPVSSGYGSVSVWEMTNLRLQATKPMKAYRTAYTVSKLLGRLSPKLVAKSQLSEYKHATTLWLLSCALYSGLQSIVAHQL